MKTYSACLIDQDGNTITDQTCETFKHAKERCAYWLSDEYAKSCETTHDRLGTDRAEVYCMTHDKWQEPDCQEVRESGDCVWDKFLNK